MKASLLYAINGLVASTHPGYLHSAFEILTEIFDQVGLRTKVCKTVGIVCKPFQVAGVQSDESYTQSITGGVDFQGYTAGTVALPGVWQGIGEEVTGGAPPNPARRVERGVGAGG